MANDVALSIQIQGNGDGAARFGSRRKGGRNQATSININKILKNFAKKNENTFFLDPYSIFCNDEFCNSIPIEEVISFEDLGITNAVLLLPSDAQVKRVE